MARHNITLLEKKMVHKDLAVDFISVAKLVGGALDVFTLLFASIPFPFQHRLLLLRIENRGGQASLTQLTY